MIYQKLALLNCSMYKVSSLNGAMCKSPLDGNILPRNMEIFTRIRIKKYIS